jgi:hypothetical protein
VRESLPSCGKTILKRETGGTGEKKEGSRFEVLGTSNRAFLACLGPHAPRSVALADCISDLLGWEKRAPTEDSIGTAEILVGL